MRRMDKKIQDPVLIEKILKEATYCHIAMIDQGKPYIVTMNYAYLDNCIYLHGAKEGRKADVWAEGADVAIQIVTGVDLVFNPGDPFPDCAYYSLVFEGKITCLKDDDQRRAALDILIDKFGGSKDYTPHWHRVEAWRVDINGEICGKKSIY